MKRALDETSRRREIQVAYNKKHGITPTSVRRDVTKSISNLQDAIAQASNFKNKKSKIKPKNAEDAEQLIAQFQEEMQRAAEDLDFEKAIALRDHIVALQKQFLNK
jgi:excinuclease ABC subunit B